MKDGEVATITIIIRGGKPSELITNLDAKSTEYVLIELLKQYKLKDLI